MPRTIEHKQPASDSVRPDTVLGLKRNELSPRVRSYADNLVTQIQGILSPHNIKSIEEFERVAKQTEKFPYKELEELQKLVNLLKQAVESNKIPETETTLSEAREIMGEQDFIGPDVLKTIYGGVEIKDVPQIPFSTQELREANKRGEFLILRLDTLPNGKPATMQNLHEYFANDFKLLVNPSNDWKLKSDFFTKETPNVSWALVSKEVIPNSMSKNYYEQTVGLRDHLKSEVYKGGMPREYEEAIQEFEAWGNATFPGKNAQQIQGELGGNNWKKYTEQLSNLKINQLCRQSGVEALFDLAVYYMHNNGVYLLPSMYTWTKSRGSDGGLVRVGRFGADGASVRRWRPDSTDDDLGVLLSRRS